MCLIAFKIYEFNHIGNTIKIINLVNLNLFKVQAITTI